MSVIGTEPATEYMDVLEKVFGQHRNKMFLLVYSAIDGGGVEIVETGQEWLMTELSQGSDISSEDKALIKRFADYWAAVGGFIKIKIDSRKAVIVRIR